MSGLPRVVPGDHPDEYRRGPLSLRVPWSRGVTVECQACGVTRVRLKVQAEHPLDAGTASGLLTRHLDTVLGWGRLSAVGADICPDCIGTKSDQCPECYGVKGTHGPTCHARVAGS